MKSDTEQARVQTLDVDLDFDASGRPIGSGGAASSRRPNQDWADAAGPVLARRARRVAARRKSVTAPEPPPLRLEFEGDDPTTIDAIGLAMDGWLLRVRLQLVDDEPSIVGLEMRRIDEAADLGSRLLRRLGLGSFVDLVGDVLQDYGTAMHIGQRWRRPVPRPGRAGRPDAFYADWAARYVSALTTEPVSPVKFLVESESSAGRHATEPQVRAYLNRARERGLLTKAPEGRPGGDLTTKARRLLKGRP